MNRSANISMPTSAQLGGSGEVPFVRFPFFPTAPWYSTNPAVGYQVRYYGATLLSTDTDYAVNSEANRFVQFDIPCRLVAINGAAINTTAPGAAVGSLSTINMNLSYLFRMEYTTGDKLHTGSRLASTCIGNAENPGEIGGVGFTVDQGSSIQLIITPLIANLRIDITLHCLEIRGQRNFN